MTPHPHVDEFTVVHNLSGPHWSQIPTLPLKTPTFIRATPWTSSREMMVCKGPWPHIQTLSKHGSNPHNISHSKAKFEFRISMETEHILFQKSGSLCLFRSLYTVILLICCVLPLSFKELSIYMTSWMEQNFEGSRAVFDWSHFMDVKLPLWFL